MIPQTIGRQNFILSETYRRRLRDVFVPLEPMAGDVEDI